MLDGLAEVDWAAFDGAYGPAVDAPDILRALASADPETARRGQFDVASTLWHQGTVYPVTVVAVPFLVELATTDGVHRRHDLLSVLGALCDPEQSDGAEQPAVRAAVAAHGERLVTQLTEPDPAVRECAAYAVARCGPHAAGALRERWTVEDDPRVRASLLLGIALHDPAGSAARLRSASLSEPYPVPAAAALAFARAGLRFPPETIAPIAVAFAGTGEWSTPWNGHGDLLADVINLVDGATAGALTAALTVDSPAPGRGRRALTTAAGRIRAADAMVERFRSRRSAPVEMMPRLRELLADTDAGVRAAAVFATACAGAPAAAVAGDLARASDHGADHHPARAALSTLVRLGDPRWREPVLAAWAAGRDPAAVAVLAEYVPAFDPDVLVGARRRLAAQVAEGRTGNPVIAVVALLKAWGPAAAEAVPEIVAALPAAPWVVAATLADLGSAALPAVPALREAAATGEVRAAHAVWRLTGDAAPLVEAASTLVATGRRRIAWDLGLVAEVGPAAAAVARALRDRLTDSPAPTHPEREDQIAAARVVWRATGAAEPILSTVEAVLRAGEVPVRSATKLAADMAPHAGADLVPALRAALDSTWGRVDAARALWRFGTAADDLVGPLLAAAADPYGDNGAIALLVEMRATGAIAGLTELADRDERVVIYGPDDETPWLDDRLRRDLHEAVHTIT